MMTLEPQPPSRQQGVGFLIPLSLFILMAGCTSPLPEPYISSSPTFASLPSSTFTPFSPPSPTFTLSPTQTASPTVTPIPSVEPVNYSVVRFAVIGDFGQAGKAEAQVAELVKSWQPDFIITTGDNNYPHGSADTIDENIGQYYHEYIYPYLGAYGEGAELNRFFPSLGNHDWGTQAALPYLEYFTLPGNERYYDFVWGPVHLFALDSDSREPDGVGKSSTQADWLEGRLATSTTTWKIVYMHYPPYSSAAHGSTGWMQWPYAEWGASVVLAGHDHVYERIIVDGFPYIVNGLGGSPYRYYFLSPIPGSQVRHNDSHGALLVEATSEMLLFSFITVDGVVVDSFSIP
ncbi:MAG: metallophosphoesterase [Chloroflexota bacterium]